MLYEKILAESGRLKKEVAALEAKISKLPEGKLVCARNGKMYKWYRSDGKKETYIPKSNRALAEQLAMKKYLMQRYEECVREKRALDFYLRHHDQSESKSAKMLTLPGYQELLKSSILTQSDELVSWMKAPFPTNPTKPEQLTYETQSGYKVRSKSELIIDMLLHMYQIPCRYECALELGEAVIYPDFTIRHPKTGELFYWEHFGMMDQMKYRTKAGSKLQLYTSHGILPSVNLITTYETDDNPLNTRTVEAVIQRYFL